MSKSKDVFLLPRRIYNRRGHYLLLLLRKYVNVAYRRGRGHSVFKVTGRVTGCVSRSFTQSHSDKMYFAKVEGQFQNTLS